jgi:iron complex outermembrane recepter protein
MLNKTVPRHAFALALATAAAGWAAPAIAQQAALERVEVTGSGIKRAQAEGASPILVIGRDQLADSGKSSVADYLQTLPIDGAGSLPTGFGNGFAAGSTAVSLRGLGAASTLVLVNGRRMAKFARADDGQKSFTDLAAIPLEAVERVEILKDSASSMYGADAIAGVVNIILRQEFTGLQASASAGQSRYGDGEQAKAALTWGAGRLGEDGFNLLLNAELYRSNEIGNRDRSSRAWIGHGDLRAWGYPEATQFAAGYLAGSDKSGASPAGALRDPASGQYVSLPGCAALSASHPPDPAGGCLWHADQFRSMQPQIDGANLYGRGAWALGAGLQAYGEALYSQRDTWFAMIPASLSATFAAPPSAGNPSGVTNWGGAMTLAAAHPQNPYGVAVPLRYSAFDVGASARHADNRASRLVAGVKGALLGWDVDGAYTHSESTLALRYTNMLDMRAVQAALGDPNSAHFPYYLGAEAGRNPAELYAALVRSATSESSSRLDMLDLRAARELLELPGGTLGLALGAEHRREALDNPSLSGTEDGSINANYAAARGATRVSALYAELAAPVLTSVELSAAARYDRYSGFSSLTPKLGAKWMPAAALALRGTYAAGFRAPGAAESGAQSQSTTNATARDPLRCPGGTPLPGASLNDCSTAVAAVTVGNPDLRPEKSKAYTLGLVWDPLRDTSVSVDGWRIRRDDEINVLPFSQAAALPTAVRADDNLTIDGVVAPGTGTLLISKAPYRNASYTQVKGVDLDLRQRLRLGDYGRASVALSWTHVGSWLRVESDGRRYQYAGTHGNCDTSNCAGTPRDKLRLSASWERGAWNVTTSATYRGPMRNVEFAGDLCASQLAGGGDAPAGCKLASFTTVDLALRWNASPQWQVFGAVSNLFDTIAPLDPLTYGGVSSNPLDAAGAVGRYVTLGARYRF